MKTQRIQNLAAAVLGLVICFAATGAEATLIDLGMTSYGDEPRIYEIYNALYDKNYADNDAIEFMENDLYIGSGLFTSSQGKIKLAARYAAAPLTLKYYDGGGEYDIVTSLPGNQIIYDPPSISYTVKKDSPFGLWGETTFGKWYSDWTLNGDDQYHFLVLNTPKPNRLLICFEDMSRRSDWDYNDFVLEVEYYTIPEPASLCLLSLGMLGFGLARGKRRIKA